MSTSADHPTGYSTPAAMWAAVTARLENSSAARHTPVSDLQRQLVYDRFLARVFTHAPSGTWVLKGGTALLSRVRAARHSRDVDLARTGGSLDDAVQELRWAATLDLADHFRFVPGRLRYGPERPGQPGRHLARLQLQPYVGVRPVHGFGVDIVVGTVITAEADRHQPDHAITIDGMPRPPYFLYPLVDHVADKVCATVELHAGQPSTRFRDLVDLVVIASTQTLGAAGLRHAIETERRHRCLSSITAWSTPPGWKAPLRPRRPRYRPVRVVPDR